MIVRLIIIVISLLSTVTVSVAQPDVITAKAASEILHLIRKEKFDLILPGAMRDNKVDMWIHVIRAGNSDPMAVHFGTVTGYIIFTDRGGNRIERAVLGDGNRPPLQVSDLFDRSNIPGSDEVDPRWLTHHSGGSSDLYDIFGSPDEIRDGLLYQTGFLILNI